VEETETASHKRSPKNSPETIFFSNKNRKKKMETPHFHSQTSGDSPVVGKSTGKDTHHSRTPSPLASSAAAMGRKQPLPACETSVLDAVGQEIVSIVAPVSICMFFCVFLVRLLRVDGDDATANMQGGIASAAYQEQVRAVRPGFNPAPHSRRASAFLLACSTWILFGFFSWAPTRKET
jgi:hypothetical protein